MNVVDNEQRCFVSVPFSFNSHAHFYLSSSEPFVDIQISHSLILRHDPAELIGYYSTKTRMFNSERVLAKVSRERWFATLL